MREKWRGQSKLARKYELNRILEIVNASPKDIFCDLGCGKGLLCIWASKKVRYAIGVEDHKDTYLKAQENKRKYNRKNVRFLHKDYEKQSTLNKLKNCSIFFCTNYLTYSFYKQFENTVKKRTHFVSQYFLPYPIISKMNEDHFIAQTPFKIAKNEKEWIHYMLGKRKTRNDLIKIIREFSDHKDKINELVDDISGINWLYEKYKK